MAWEARARGGRYYCRTVRTPGGRVRQYVGCGEWAEQEAARDVAERARRLEEATAQRAAQAVRAARERMINDAYQETETLLRATLAAAGYYRHRRGEWRRRPASACGAGERLV